MVDDQETVPPGDSDRAAPRDAGQLAEDPPKLVCDARGNADGKRVRAIAQDESPGGTLDFPEINVAALLSKTRIG